jgi:hypothetical protein
MRIQTSADAEGDLMNIDALLDCRQDPGKTQRRVARRFVADYAADGRLVGLEITDVRTHYALDHPDHPCLERA